uniref:Oxysterol binding protein like 1A n=1 Tax=Cyclopterus lumpus TaxID=8103 RepID=A0A8C2WQN9_CYCLU
MEADTLEKKLLFCAKEGSRAAIQKLLESRVDQSSKSKTTSGWTPLHLACYFGHRDAVEELLKAGADANVQNNMGDTPLHKAAYTGRKAAGGESSGSSQRGGHLHSV